MGRLSGTRSLTDISRLAQFTRPERATGRASMQRARSGSLTVTSSIAGFISTVDYRNGKGAYKQQNIEA